MRHRNLRIEPDDNEFTWKTEEALKKLQHAKGFAARKERALKTIEANAATFEIRDTPMGVIDLDRTAASRGLVNRYWSYFFHRGIIDPVDDIRASNPPSNPELLAALDSGSLGTRSGSATLVLGVADA